MEEFNKVASKYPGYTITDDRPFEIKVYFQKDKGDLSVKNKFERRLPMT